jgi:hypothetical protein
MAEAPFVVGILVIVGASYATSHRFCRNVLAYELIKLMRLDDDVLPGPP